MMKILSRTGAGSNSKGGGGGGSSNGVRTTPATGRQGSANADQPLTSTNAQGHDARQPGALATPGRNHTSLLCDMCPLVVIRILIFIVETYFKVEAYTNSILLERVQMTRGNYFCTCPGYRHRDAVRTHRPISDTTCLLDGHPSGAGGHIRRAHLTSAKSTLMRPGLTMMSEIPTTPLYARNKRVGMCNGG